MTTLHNRYHKTAGPDAVYIGRGSPWGNPFVIGTHGDREEVIEAFRERLFDDPQMIARVRAELAGHDLVCFCKPAPCHGDVLMEVANSSACTCCGASAAQVAVDDEPGGSGLCLWCQPCPNCNRMGTGCQDRDGANGCDPLPNASGETLGSAAAPSAHQNVMADSSPAAGVVEYRTGDLLNQPDLDAIAHGVNCQGAMGAGIAKVIRNRWPDLYEPYRERCDDGRLAPGKGFAWSTGQTPPQGPKWIYNLASQNQPGPDARLEWVESSLAGALRHAETNGVDGFGLPRIASDIGGLEWVDVRAVIEKVAATSPVRVVVVTLPGVE